MGNKEIIALSINDNEVRGVKIASNREAWLRSNETFLFPLKVEIAPEAEEQNAQIAEDDLPLVRALREARKVFSAQELVLALPLSKLMTTMIRVPLDARSDLIDAVSVEMSRLTPFPEEDLAIGFEIVRETEDSLWVFVTALPQVISDEIGDALTLAKLNVLRTDVSALGWYRALYSEIVPNASAIRAVSLLFLDDEWDLLVLEAGSPLLVRGLGRLENDDELIREVMLSLLKVELDFGRKSIDDISVVKSDLPSEAFVSKLEVAFGAKVRYVVPKDPWDGVEGIARRTRESADVLDVTPGLWKFALKMKRLREKVTYGAAIAMTIWVVFMGWLFGTPMFYTWLDGYQKNIMKKHAAEYRAVSDTKERVNLVLSYTDRSKSVLEIMRLISNQLPEGITLLSMQYKREDGIKISGEADQPTLVYQFKNTLTENEVFTSVTLTGPSASRGKHKFDIHATFFNNEELLPMSQQGGR